MEVYRTSTINGEFRFCLFLFIFGLEIWFCLIEGTCFDRFRTETTIWKLKGPCQISCFNTSCSEKSPFKWGIPVYTHDVFFLWIIPNKEGKQNTEPWTAGHCSFVTAMCMDGWLEEELELVFKWISYIYIHIYTSWDINQQMIRRLTYKKMTETAIEKMGDPPNFLEGPPNHRPGTSRVPICKAREKTLGWYKPSPNTLR
jgi:hypothetical protein